MIKFLNPSDRSLFSDYATLAEGEAAVGWAPALGSPEGALAVCKVLGWD